MDYLKALLIDKGVMTEQGLTRKARLVIHRPCGLLTLSGLDADLAALEAWCDPYALTNQGEFQAIIAGRRTYQLRGDRLDHRDKWIIPGRPAEGRYPVYASHDCQVRLPMEWRLPRPEAIASTAQGDEVPF